MKQNKKDLSQNKPNSNKFYPILVRQIIADFTYL